jgi:hypothetical protein
MLLQKGQSTLRCIFRRGLQGTVAECRLRRRLVSFLHQHAVCRRDLLPTIPFLVRWWLTWWFYVVWRLCTNLTSLLSRFLKHVGLGSWVLRHQHLLLLLDEHILGRFRLLLQEILVNYLLLGRGALRWRLYFLLLLVLFVRCPSFKEFSLGDVDLTWVCGNVGETHLLILLARNTIRASLIRSFITTIVFLLLGVLSGGFPGVATRGCGRVEKLFCARSRMYRTGWALFLDFRVPAYC